jgi:hypothetical protein
VIGDGGGKERTARRAIRGATKVARFVPDLLVLEIDADGRYQEVVRVAGDEVSEVHQPFTVRVVPPDQLGRLRLTERPSCSGTVRPIDAAAGRCLPSGDRRSGSKPVQTRRGRATVNDTRPGLRESDSPPS